MTDQRPPDSPPAGDVRPIELVKRGKNMTGSKKKDLLAERILADLLGVTNPDDVAGLVARRVQHLPPHQAYVTVGQVIAFLSLVLIQIREHSVTGAAVLDDCRMQVAAAIVAGTFPTSEV